MSTEQRVINREYLETKSLIYIGEEIDDPQLLDIFHKAFKKCKISKEIEDIKQEIKEYDIIVCNETDHSLSHLQEIRALENKQIPFVLIENAKYKTNPVLYIKDNLSQYIKLTPTYTEIMYIIQHELQNYDKQIENMHLQAEHKAYLEMLDNTVIVSRTDLKGKITYANDIFCEISKYSRDELVGAQHKILRHPEISKTVFQDLWETIKRDEIWKGVIKNKDKEGETYITNTTIAPYYTNGEKVGYIGIRYVVTDDVTEKRNLKNYLTKLTIDTKKLLQEKDQEIASLKKKNKMVDAIEDAWHIEKAKKEQLEKQISKFEQELKKESAQHNKRVESYLQERREYTEVLSNKDREIALLKDHLYNSKTQNDEYENVMLDSGKETLQLKKRIKDLEDIIKHQEEQLKKKL